MKSAICHQEAAGAPSVCEASFLGRSRPSSDRQAGRDLNERLDSLALPALSAHLGGMEQLPASLAAAAESDCSILDP